MTTREKRMLAVVGLLGLGGVVFAAYELIAKPLEKASADYRKLGVEQVEKQQELDKVRKDLERLKVAKKRSLPADQDVAKREYESVLSSLLREARVPHGFTIVPNDKSTDIRSIPEIAPKKPAYSRIGYDVRMQKVDMPTLTRLLKAYYDLNLLHQITNIEVKRIEKDLAAGGQVVRRTNDRADLDVTLHVEGIILDGAEDRKALLPIPDAVAAVAGFPAFRAVQNVPELSHSQKAQLFRPVLAYDEDLHTRNYLAMEARDYFHGPLPPPPKGPEKVIEDVKPVVVPSEDISPYIKLNAITTSTTGVRQATIWDRALNKIYEVSILDDDSKPEVRVRKYFMLAGQMKLMDRFPELVISEDTTATNLTFKVLGFYEDGLVLTGKVSKDKEKDKDTAATDPKAEPKKATTPQRGGGRDRSPPKATKEQIAQASVLGGLAMVKPTVTEQVFFWQIGQSLKYVADHPLEETDGKALLKKMTAPPTTAPAGTELAPSPRPAN